MRRRFGVEEVGDVRELFCLRGDGSKPAFVAAAEGANADAAGKIDIAFAVKILQRCVLALFQRNRKSLIGAQYVRIR